jgi:hypothetical protein
MKTSLISSRALVIAALLLGATNIAANDDAAAAAGSKAEATKPSKPGIARGMSADEIRRIIGEPKTIKKIKSEELNAEKWTYRRKLRTETTQEPVRTESQPAFVGMGMGDASGLGTINVSVYRLRHTTFYQVTALLMVDGTMIEARQWVETEVNYEG